MSNFGDTVKAVCKAQLYEGSQKLGEYQVEEVLRALGDVLTSLKEGDAIRLLNHNGKFVGKFYIATLAAKSGKAGGGVTWHREAQKVLKFKRNMTKPKKK